MNALGLKGTQVMCIYYLASNPEGLTAADLCTRSESNIKPSSKSYVGYVHAIAYSLGGEYNIPHGLANAVMNALFGIGTTIPEIREEDISKLSYYADKEANPLYPVPVLMDANELETFYYTLMEDHNDRGRD